jgi:c(7)-type cytochrome triheme protein
VKKLAILVTLLAVLAFVGSALAVPPGKTAEFPDGAMGKVVFDGKVHADAGLKCMDCHPKTFAMKREVKITAPHKAGEFCFMCHDGSKAFDFKDNCAKCHKK